MFDTSKVRRLKWKARVNEGKHRVAAAWNRALVEERDMMLRTERNLNRWRRNTRKRMEAARLGAEKARKRTETAKEKARRATAKTAAKAAAKTAAATAAVKMAGKAARKKARGEARAVRAARTTRPMHARRAATA